MIIKAIVNFAAAVAAVAAAFSTAGAAPNLIRNGSFEKPAAVGGGFIVVAKGERIGAWRVVGAEGEIGLINEDYTTGGFTAPARAGKQWLDLTPRATLTPTAIGVRQAVSTTPGQDYILTFFVGNVHNPGGSLGTTSTVHVFVDGGEVLSATNRAGTGKTHVVWRRFSVELTATRRTTKIVFINGDSDDLNGLDKVSLVAAP